MKLWKWIVADRSKAQLIFIGACILSYTHTLNLFERSGYSGILSHIGTIICELMFLLGITSKTPNRRTRWALIFGGSIVLYSNISFGLAKGKAIVFYTFPNGMVLSEVTLCGILIPLLVWVAEWVKGYKEEEVTQPASHTQPVAQSESHTDSHTTSQPWLDSLTVSHTLTHEQTITQSDSHNDSHTVSQPQFDSHILTQAHAASQSDSHSLTTSQAESHSNTHAAASTHTTAEPHTETDGDSHADTQPHDVRETHTDSHTAIESHNESHTQQSHTSHTEEDSHNVSESHKESSHTISQSHAEADSHTDPHTEESHNEPRDPREVALEYYKKYGKFPSIRGLAAETGCGEWQARVILRELKKQKKVS